MKVSALFGAGAIVALAFRACADFLRTWPREPEELTAYAYPHALDALSARLRMR